MQCVPSKTPRIPTLPRQQRSCSGRTTRTVGLNTIKSGPVPSTMRIVAPSLKSPSTRVMNGFQSGYAALFDTTSQTSAGGRSIRTSACTLVSSCRTKRVPITPTTLITIPLSSSPRKPIFARIRLQLHCCSLERTDRRPSTHRCRTPIFGDATPMATG